MSKGGLGYTDMGPHIVRLFNTNAITVSAAALLVRLEQLRIINNSTLVYLFQTTAKGWRNNEPEPLEGAENQGTLEMPKRFENLCYLALSEGLISLQKAAELLQKPVREVQRETRGPQSS